MAGERRLTGSNRQNRSVLAAMHNEQGSLHAEAGTSTVSGNADRDQAWAGGLAAAVVIGAAAGLLPAIRAARLSPTQALWSI